MIAPPAFALPEFPGTYARFARLPKHPEWIGGAVFSDEGNAAGGPLHRYILTRHLEVPAYDNPGRALVACMLNPSTADPEQDDNTVNRMRIAAFNLGFNALIVVNMFALCSTKPTGLSKVADPVGAHNDAAIAWAADLASRNGDPVVCGWGVNVEKKQAWMARARAVAGMLARTGSPAAWRLTAFGHPEHPLYLPNPLTPIPWHGAVGYSDPPVATHDTKETP